jgi:hypothetical protein
MSFSKSVSNRFTTCRMGIEVPAMHRTDAPQILGWIRQQHMPGATIVAICSGGLVIAEAGLLDGRRATTHWFDFDSLRRRHSTTTMVGNRRYVVDRGVVTTTGVTASVPISLALVEAIAGRAHAQTLASRLGASHDWTDRHSSESFGLSLSSVWLAAKNWLMRWRHERIGIQVEQGVDEIALAFSADTYSRTYRSRAFAISSANGPIRTKRGITLLPEDSEKAAEFDYLYTAAPDERPVTALDDIQRRYGADTAAFVGLQLEYARVLH